METSAHITPAVSPASDVLSDEESDKVQENIYLHLPDTVHVFTEDLNSESLEEEGYHTNDNISELEDNELKKGLTKWREKECELVAEIDQEVRNIFYTLMRDVNWKEWNKAESN